MKRVFNFSPGPAMLPEPVLRKAQEELLDWQGSGMSVMEVSHRGTDFIEFAARSERALRELLRVPDGYKVLFLQGGATLQFAAVPLNLAPAGSVADYVVTGNWGEKAVQEAERYIRVNVAANSKATKFTTVPDPSTWQVSSSAAYLHYTPNETVFGVEFHSIPEVSDAPLVADMSSTLLSRPLDVSRFGVIYAGAQKNIGPAGLAIVIVRDDLLGRARRETPGVIDYKTMAENDSMWNTPSTLAWYFAGLVFDWLKEQGGLEAMGKVNARKAAKLYGAIDGSGYYKNPVDKAYRSSMNIPFTLPDAALDKPFLQEAKAAGLTNLKGHRVVGGMRASLYNAMPEAGVDALVAFMADFAKRHG
jgi:phosphoserine aminotransferase